VKDTKTFAARSEYGDERRAAIARIYQMYEDRLHANNALDFR
jgi:superfamily I DNA/RNA helicase